MEGWGDYPLDTVFVRTEQRTVGDVVQRIDKERYILDPDFQRDFVWGTEKQSRLIESFLMRIPLPVVYVAEAQDGRIIVVDGLQRLTTFTGYINNDFALTGLGRSDKDGEITGKKFDDLALKFQERIEDTQLTLYILDPKAPEQARLDIFERVNSGVPLNRQQMRNCLHMGPATLWLKDQTKSETFLEATGKSLNSKSMRDREVVNRFCAFYLLGYDTYRGDMDSFLADALKKMNAMDSSELSELSKTLEKALKANYVIFEKHTFRKSILAPDKGRTVLNVALFEVCMVLFASLKLDLETVRQNKAVLSELILDLLRDDDFKRSITNFTNNKNMVETRFSKMAQASSRIGIAELGRIFYDHPIDH